MRSFIQEDPPRDCHLLGASELKVLTALHKVDNLMDNHNETYKRTLNEYTTCKCSLCVEKNNVINSCVSKAKRLIDEAVQTFSDPPSYVVYTIKNKNKLHLIGLLHIFFLSLCMSGLF